MIRSKFASEIMWPLVQPYSIFVVQNCNKSLFSSSRYGFRPITIFTATSTQEFISPEPCLGWLENPSNHGNLPGRTFESPNCALAYYHDYIGPIYILFEIKNRTFNESRCFFTEIVQFLNGWLDNQSKGRIEFEIWIDFFEKQSETQ